MSSSVLQEEPVSLADVPEAYHDLRTVFSKSRASSLPLHRPYDCAIELLPGTSLPKGRIYSLSRPEREAMEKYPRLSGSMHHSTLFFSGWGMVLLRGEERWFVALLHRLLGVEWHHGEESLSLSLTPPRGTLSIWSCHLGFLTPRRSSRHSSAQRHGRPVRFCLPRRYPDLLPEWVRSCPAHQASTPAATWESFIRQVGEVRVSRKVGSVPRIHPLSRGYPNGSCQSKSSCWLAHPRES